MQTTYVNANCNAPEIQEDFKKRRLLIKIASRIFFVMAIAYAIVVICSVPVS